MLPNKPAIELNKMNKAEVAAASFIFAQDNKMMTGLKKMPPPIFKSPEIKPMVAPMNNINGN